MKQVFTFLFAMILTVGTLQAQTLEELKAQKAELTAKKAEAQGIADGFAGEIAGLQKQIDILSGWRTGLAGNLGFGLNSFSNWAAAANPNSSTSGFDLFVTAFANKLSEKTLWNNKLIIQEGFNKVNTAGLDDTPGLFSKENHAVDLVNFASLYGYRIHPKFAISALGELNTSLSNFLEPGVLDIGVGGTWTPTNNLVVVIHPLNYHVAFSGLGENPVTSGALGAKIRADYTNSYVIAGKTFNLSSTLTSFLPYSDPGDLPNPAFDATNPGGVDEFVSPFEFAWINNISFEVWNGIGVGVGFGFRGAKFESPDTQSYYNLGLSYNL